MLVREVAVSGMSKRAKKLLDTVSDLASIAKMQVGAVIPGVNP